VCQLEVSRRALARAPFFVVVAMMIAADLWIFCLALIVELACRAPLLE
jgi:hypothetical protein